MASAVSAHFERERRGLPGWGSLAPLYFICTRLYIELYSESRGLSYIVYVCVFEFLVEGWRKVGEALLFLALPALPSSPPTGLLVDQPAPLDQREVLVLVGDRSLASLCDPAAARDGELSYMRVLLDSEKIGEPLRLGEAR